MPERGWNRGLYESAAKRKATSGRLHGQVLGIHFEGPFISKARRGVHPEEWIAAPSLPLLANLLKRLAVPARIITLAPELPGALELIRRGARRGAARFSRPHGRDLRATVAAIAPGRAHAAHVFNAMRPFSHRDTGVIGAVLTQPEVTAELIADGIHVDGPAIKILLAAKGARGISW